METVRYFGLSFALGLIAVWAGENMFWFAPPADLRLWDLFWAVVAYSIACGAALSLVIWAGVSGWKAAFLGGAVMGYLAEGVIVGTIYAPLPFFWVWTPLAWHALISGGLVLGLGRAGAALGPVRMAALWTAVGVCLAFWAQYWPSEFAGPLPGRGALALYLAGFCLLVVVAHLVMDTMAQVPRPPAVVLWIMPAIATLVWMLAGVADLNPLRVILPLALGLLAWVMRRLGQRGVPIPLGPPVPVWQHALVLIAPLIAVGLAPVGWDMGLGTLGANWVVALVTCVLSLVILGLLIRRAARRP